MFIRRRMILRTTVHSQGVFGYKLPQTLHKQQIFIALSSGGWEFHQGACRSDIWWRPAFWFVDGHLVMSSCGREHREKASSPVSSYTGPNTIHKGSTLVTQSPPKGPSLNTVTLGVRISTYEYVGKEGRTNIQSIAQGYCEEQNETLHLKAICKI